MTLAFFGFLPWSDPARGIEVRDDPASRAAALAARELASRGEPAAWLRERR